VAEQVSMSAFDATLEPERIQLEAFIEDYRTAIERTLDGLTEEQARRRLVPSATTLLGLLKHVTWMQRVWFEQCVGGTPRTEFGVQSVDESFQLGDDDTIATILAAHRKACATARSIVADLPLDTVATGHAAGPRTLRWVYLQVLRELAHHCGHADILREQILAN
jgi:uncharacterized damage-inducible protein DinB